MDIGLTGGIATGKSTVSEMFRKRGAIVLDADQIAREVVEPGTEGARRIRERFGASFFDSEGRLDRAALGQLVFRDEQARKDLSRLLHPLIVEELKKRSQEAQRHDPQAIVIWDVPLLIESRLTNLVEKVIVVYIPESLQLRRLMTRNHFSEEEAWRRIRAQLSIEEKKKYADYVIDNSGSIENTERQVDRLWNYLRSRNGFNQR